MENEDKLHITTREKKGIIILDITGEIDLYNAPTIKEIIMEHVEKDQVKIIINFEQVRYIDSSGIGVLISSLQKLKKTGGGLRIINIAYESVRKVFDITKLDSFFDIKDTEDEAIYSFS